MLSLENDVKLRGAKTRKIVNKLNDLSGKEWIKFTKSWSVFNSKGEKISSYNKPENRKVSEKSWFIHVPPPREDDKIKHPASFPESLIEEFIEFFTKRGDWVLDPFLGSGSTLLACYETGRNGIGIEISEHWATVARQRLENVRNQSKIDKFMGKEETRQIIIVGDSRKIDRIWEERSLPKVKYVITSPPYWNQLKRNYIRQKKRVEKGLPTIYSDDPRDLGNIDEYSKFLLEQKLIFDKVYDVVEDRGYLTVITNNIYADGRVYPLAFDTLLTLSDKWVPKDEKLWLQDDKPLIPLGVYSSYIGNRHHQYCLIFRKEEEKLKKQRRLYQHLIEELHSRLKI
jgi:DNA modification methylase